MSIRASFRAQASRRPGTRVTGGRDRFRRVPSYFVRALSLLAALALSTLPALAGPPVQGTNSRAARKEATKAIPFDKLDEDMQEKVQSVIDNTSIFRRLPVQVIDCDPDMYLFLLRNPEVVVNIWQVMGITNVAVKRVGPEVFRATDGAGTASTIQLCYSNRDTHVIYAEGSYDGPLFSRPLKAKCVLLLKSGYVQETNGRHYVTSRLDTFIQIEHAGVELLAKTFQPLVTKSADYNFIETTAFFGNISRTAEANSQGMVRLANKLTKVNPDVRQEFADLSLAVAKKATQRQVSQKTAEQTAASSKPLRTRTLKR